MPKNEIQPTIAPSVKETWLQAGSLVYRLTDEHLPRNHDEISVTMANGSRDIAGRTNRATQILRHLTATANNSAAKELKDLIEALASELRERLQERPNSANAYHLRTWDDFSNNLVCAIEQRMNAMVALGGPGYSDTISDGGMDMRERPALQT